VLDLAEIFRRHWPDYQQRFGAQLLPSHRRAVAALLSCRTPPLGGQVYRCECGATHYAYHSCHHRACPKCGHAQASHWLARQRCRLLPVPYFLVTFTVPQELRALWRSHQRLCYDLHLRESAATLQNVAARPKPLGAELGMLGVLHTWSRQLIYHPHVHFIVPGGGLTPDGREWKRTRNEFLLPERVLAARWRTRCKEALQRQAPALWAQVPAAAWRKGWVVDVLAVGSGEGALKYLSAYVYRTALGAGRIVADDERGVSFRYRDSDTGCGRTATVAAEEFIRRFLQHVLPKGFQRVRAYGWLGAAAKAKRARIAALLGWRAPSPPARQPLPAPLCPCCRRPMLCVAEIPRAPP
jgi:hypothetical protein